MIGAALPAGQVLILDRWITEEACRALRDDLRFGWWWPSELAFVDRASASLTRRSILRTSSTSSETWMAPGARRRLRAVEQRLARTFDIDRATLEPWQATRYRRGERFDEHHDAGLFASSLHGERTTSVLLYLDDHEHGGATVFPVLGLRVRPRAGRLVIWRNLLDDRSPDPRMRHAGLTARATKTILTTWAREFPVRPTTKRRCGDDKSQQGRPDHPGDREGIRAEA